MGYLLLPRVKCSKFDLNLLPYLCSETQSQGLKDFRKIGTPTFFCRLEGTLKLDI
jgi:hypothetical protein